MDRLLAVQHLHLELPTDDGMQPVVQDVSLTIAPGEALGLVGESGSGKTLTGRSLVRLLPTGARVTGEIEFDGESVLAMDRPRLRSYRSADVGVIFQDPRVAINPVHKVGDFLTEALVVNQRVPASEAKARAVRVLEEVGIEDGAHRLLQYPHELSGGLLQRVMIASTLLTEPRLLIADEPTTALDVTTQTEIIMILDELRRQRGLGLLFITHDLDLAAAICDRTAVMYAGRIMETRASQALHSDPLHPYSAALIQSRPSIEGAVERLRAIAGRPQSAFQAPPGCPFAPRCSFVQAACRETVPPTLMLAGGEVACLRAEELQGGALLEGLERTRV